MKRMFLILFISSIIIAGCHNVERPLDNSSKNQNHWVLGRLSKASLSSTLTIPGVLKPFESVAIYPRINGFIKELYVDRGSVVKKGQLLILLEAPEVEQQYYAAKSKYLQAYALLVSSRDNYNRLLNTAKTPGTVAVHDLEQVRDKFLSDSALVQSEMSNYKAMETMKNYLKVAAPFDGVITERNVHPGALVGPSSRSDDKPLLVLEQQGHLRLVMEIPEVYTNQLSSNTSLTFKVNSLPGKVFKTNISREAGTLSMRYRSETIEADVFDNYNVLKPGMYAQVLLPVERTESCYVAPSKSIITSTERKYVVCVRNGYTKWIDIQEGNSRNDSTEIFGKLNTDDKIIINASEGIQDAVLFK